MQHNRSTIQTIARALLGIYGFLALVPFFCVADQALGHWGLLPTSATLLCALLLLPFTALLTLRSLHVRETSRLIRLVSLNWLPLGAFVTIGLVALTWSILPGAYWAEDGKWIFLVCYGILISMLGLAVGSFESIVKLLPLYIAASLALLFGSIWYDSLHPGTFAPIENRAAGFPGNANFAALVANLLCCAGLNFGSPSLASRMNDTSPRRDGLSDGTVWWDALLVALTFLIVVTTMSRSGLVNFAALIGAYLYFRLLRSPRPAAQRSREIIALGLCAVVVAASLPLISDYLSSVHGGKTRLSRFLNNERVDDGSAGTRLAAAKDSIRLIEESPLVGHGTGFARTMFELPHNLYLQQWVNNGVVGLAAFLALLVGSLLTFTRRRCRQGQAFIFVASVGSVFSHNLLDQRPFLILLGILLASSLGAPRTPNTSTWR